jgi:class 3 adenylate cyclase
MAAPAGTVTRLFIDIEGSSDGVRTFGSDQWEAILERHTQIP